MVADAEAHAEEDAKAKALVDARNQAESLVNGVKKSMEDGADVLDDGEKEAIEAGITDLEESLKSEDVDDINAKSEALMQVSHKLAEKMYAQGQEGAAGAEQQESPQDDNVVDAEFEDVTDEDDTKDA